MKKENTQQRKPKKCNCKKHKFVSFIKLSGGQTATEIECIHGNRKII